MTTEPIPKTDLPRTGRTGRVLLPFVLCIPLGAADFLPNTFKARFTEHRTKMITGQRVSHSGNIEYRYPGNLRIEVEGRVKTVLVVNAEKTWHYTSPFIEGEKGELKISATSATTSPGKLFDMMRHGLHDNEHYGVSRRGGGYVLTPKKKTADDSKVDWIRLNFEGAGAFKNLKTMEVLRAKKTTLYTFEAIETDIAIDPGRFRFDPPEGTNTTSF